jgi:hypothetical protein
MPTQLSILWFAITAGGIVTGILIMLMYTRKRLSSVNHIISEAQRVIAGDRITVVERQIQMIFDLIERRLAALLHAPHLPAMDELLRKVTTQDVTPDEARELYIMLIERREDLTVEGVSRPDLDFPELFVLWSLEVRMARAGIEIPRPSLSSRNRPPPQARGGGSHRV